jgi:hypothetical protein
MHGMHRVHVTPKHTASWGFLSFLSISVRMGLPGRLGLTGMHGAHQG